MNGPAPSGDDVALFIDWENFKISLAVGHRLPNVSALKEEAANYGRVVVAKAYADWVARAPELRGARLKRGMWAGLRRRVVAQTRDSETGAPAVLLRHFP